MSTQALQQGEMLQWFRIEKVLGRGGFGITYLATDTNLDHLVAIKEYAPDTQVQRTADNSLDPISNDAKEIYHSGLTRFISEARTLVKFNHPSIVRIITVFEANHTAYLVMDYEEGEVFKNYIRRNGSLPEARLKDIFLKVADGLSQVHERGFLHRDIKPANLIIRKDGNPVLLDFGCARPALLDNQNTHTAFVSPGFSPLEQFHSAPGMEEGPWTDIYALSATLHFAISQENPPNSVSRIAAVASTLEDPLTPAVEIGKDLYSLRFLEAIDWGLKPQINDRPETLAKWRDALTAHAPAIDDSTVLIPRSAVQKFAADESDDDGTRLYTAPSRQVHDSESVNFTTSVRGDSVSQEFEPWDDIARDDQSRGDLNTRSGRPGRLGRRNSVAPAVIGLAGVLVAGIAGWVFFGPSDESSGGPQVTANNTWSEPVGNLRSEAETDTSKINSSPDSGSDNRPAESAATIASAAGEQVPGKEVKVADVQQRDLRAEQEKQAALEEEQKAEQLRHAQLEQQQAELNRQRQDELEQQRQAKLEQQRKEELEEQQQATLAQQRAQEDLAQQQQAELEQQRQAAQEQQRAEELEQQRLAELEQQREAEQQQAQRQAQEAIDQEVAGYIAQIEAAIGGSRYRQADTLLSKARALDANNAKIAHLTKLNKNAEWHETTLAQAERFLQSGDLAASRESYNLASAMGIDNAMSTDLQKRITDAEKSARDIPGALQAADQYLANQNWSAAVSEFQRVLNLDGNNRDASNGLGAVREKWVSHIESDISKGRYGVAQAGVSELEATLGEADDTKALLQKIDKARREAEALRGGLASAESLIENAQHTQALEQLNLLEQQNFRSGKISELKRRANEGIEAEKRYAYQSHLSDAKEFLASENLTGAEQALDQARYAGAPEAELMPLTQMYRQVEATVRDRNFVIPQQDIAEAEHRFDQLARAVMNRNLRAVSQLTIANDQKLEILEALVSRSKKMRVEIKNLSQDNQAKKVSATLELQNIVLSSGQTFVPSSELRVHEISVELQPDGWSKIDW